MRFFFAFSNSLVLNFAIFKLSRNSLNKSHANSFYSIRKRFPQVKMQLTGWRGGRPWRGRIQPYSVQPYTVHNHRSVYPTTHPLRAPHSGVTQVVGRTTHAATSCVVHTHTHTVGHQQVTRMRCCHLVVDVSTKIKSVH